MDQKTMPLLRTTGRRGIDGATPAKPPSSAFCASFPLFMLQFWFLHGRLHLGGCFFRIWHAARSPSPQPGDIPQARTACPLKHPQGSLACFVRTGPSDRFWCTCIVLQSPGSPNSCLTALCPVLTRRWTSSAAPWFVSLPTIMRLTCDGGHRVLFSLFGRNQAKGQAAIPRKGAWFY